MGCLSIYHPDIYDFLESKSWDEGKLTHFNLSILIDDKFMEAVNNDANIYLHYPCMDEKGELIYNESQWKIKKEIKAKDLWDLIMKKAYNTGEYGVLYYDNMNRDNNLYYMENIVTTNPCGEYLSGVVYNNNKVKCDYFGACNLGSLFLHNFVVNPFEKNAYIDLLKLEKTIRIAVRLLDNIIDINNYPLQQFENYQKNIRTIGLGITGLADLFTMMNVIYGSDESIKLTDKLMNFITLIAYDQSCNLAIEKGSFNLLNKEKYVESNFIKKHIKNNYSGWENIKTKILQYGIRNARLISVAPTGTLSLAFGNNCSSGLEPIFNLEYDRKIKIGGQDEEDIQILKMRDYAYELWINKNKEKETFVKKDVFVTSSELNVQSHLNILSTIAFHTDMSCSKTINIPSDYSFENTKEVYMKCWKQGIKGCTIFRPNEIRQGILLNKKEEVVKEQVGEQLLGRGDWEQKPSDIIYIQRKLTSGCGKLILFVGVSPSMKRIFDTYIKKSGKGGCKCSIEGNAILMSGMLRLGGKLCNIEKAFRGIEACNSFVNARAKGKELSKGSSCPDAMLNILKKVEKDMHNGCLKEFREIGIYSDTYKESHLNENILNNLVTNEKINYTEIDKPMKESTEKFTKKERKFLEENGEISFALKFNKCPICSETLENAGGCKTCINCGWTKCD